MKVGDVVEVRFVCSFGPDKYIPARVVAVRGEAFTVQALRGAFDADGHDFMDLELRGREQQWR